MLDMKALWGLRPHTPAEGQSPLETHMGSTKKTRYAPNALRR